MSVFIFLIARQYYLNRQVKIKQLLAIEKAKQDQIDAAKEEKEKQRREQLLDDQKRLEQQIAHQKQLRRQLEKENYLKTRTAEQAAKDALKHFF